MKVRSRWFVDYPVGPDYRPNMSQLYQREVPVSSKDVNHIDILKTQLTYFTSHLGLADAKAAGIVVFSTTLCKETVDKTGRFDWHLLHFAQILGIAGIGISCLTIVCAYKALQPRPSHGRVNMDIFGWVGVSANASAGDSHASRFVDAGAAEIARGIANTTEDLAQVIARKYAWIKQALYLLLPSMLMQFAYWLLL